MYCESNGNKQLQEADPSFNRALCIVNYMKETIQTLTKSVLIEHYVL